MEAKHRNKPQSRIAAHPGHPLNFRIVGMLLAVPMDCRNSQRQPVDILHQYDAAEDLKFAGFLRIRRTCASKSATGNRHASRNGRSVPERDFLRVQGAGIQAARSTATWIRCFPKRRYLVNRRDSPWPAKNRYSSFLDWHF
jgi:hypothetical protein